MSTFEWENPGKQVRETGTLHAPGSTPGDVLTINADKSVSPAPGGGSMPVQPRVLFDSNRDVGGGGNWVYVAEKTGLKRVSALSDYGFTPVWDRSTYTRCAYARWLDYEHDPSVQPTVVVQPDLTDPSSAVVVAPDPGGGLSIFNVQDWAPDGSLIAYMVTGDPNGTALHVVAPDGSGDVEIVAPGGAANANLSGARFSPDGSLVAYGRLDFAPTGVYVVGVDGSGNTLIVPEASLGGAADSGSIIGWSKYGQIIISWVAHGTGIAQIWMCDSDGGNLTQLSAVAAGGGPAAGCLNPDNDQFIYATGGVGALQQATLDVVASSLLTSGGFTDQNPSYG